MQPQTSAAAVHSGPRLKVLLDDIMATPEPRAAPREWLIIGGTQFMGRHLVSMLLDDATERVTLLNRGKTPTPWLPSHHARLRRMRCDRFAERATLRALVASAAWDVVVDFQAFDPPQVQDIADSMNPGALYIFISTDSVYMASPPPPPHTLPVGLCAPLREEDARLPRDAADTAAVARRDNEYQAEYGGGKLRCEAWLRQRRQRRRALRWVALRLPDVVGPHDNCGGFLDLLELIAAEGSVVGTGGLCVRRGLERRISLVYALDVARAVVCVADLDRAAAAVSSASPTVGSSSTASGVVGCVFNVACDEQPRFEELCAAVQAAAVDDATRRELKRAAAWSVSGAPLGAPRPPTPPTLRAPLRFDAARENPMVTVSTGPLDTSAWRALTIGAWTPTPLAEVVQSVVAWYSDPRNAAATKRFVAGSSETSESSSEGDDAG